MKYYNERTKEWYIDGKPITKRLNNCTLFSGIPSVEQLNEWGFIAVSDEEESISLFEQVRKEKLNALELYDNSSAVNEFSLNGNPMWLTREERTQIDESINAYEGVGATEMTKYFYGVPYTFSLTVWKQMLNALIVYASESLNNTERHKAAINAFKDNPSDSSNTALDELIAYDFTTGYPQKLAF